MILIFFFNTNYGFFFVGLYHKYIYPVKLEIGPCIHYTSHHIILTLLNRGIGLPLSPYSIFVGQNGDA